MGAVGAIFGGVCSYAELQTLLIQTARHNQFEQLTNSNIVQATRKRIQESESADPFADIAKPIASLPTKKQLESIATSTPTSRPPKQFDLSEGRVCPLDAPDNSGCWTNVNKGDIKTIHWAKGKGLVVESIETEDGQTVYPTPAPSRWPYLFAAILPLLGFLIPWGAIRAIGWVAAGFVASTR